MSEPAPYPDTPRPKVAICIPAHDQCSTLFANDLARLALHTGAGPVAAGVLEGVGINTMTATYVHRARQELAEYAMESGADYLLWLDSDMRFPRDALIRLLAHNKPIVGVNYSNRGVPPEFVAIKNVGPPGEKCITGPEDEGLERVDAVGGGVCLVRGDVYTAMYEDRPWYWYGLDDENMLHTGEDVFFCQKAAEYGFQTFVDHDLSKECGHVGSIEYLTDHAYAMQEREEQPVG